jgi:ribosomal protein L11 methyltransferase
LPRGSLLDVGSGSGMLAVAAAKLGFAPVYAVDVDPVAVAMTIDNARANDVEVDAREADALRVGLPETAVAIANITLEGVRGIAPHLGTAHLVTSGYLEADRPALDRRQHLRRATRQGWAADVWTSAEE